MGVINAIERFQKQANEASSDKIEATRQLALVADNIISATKLQEKRKEKEEEKRKLIVNPEEIEKIFAGDQKSPIISKREKREQNEQEIG